MTKKKPKAQSSTIALNKKAKHNYFLEQKFEAGISLMGWEVKSLREGKVNLTDTYVLLQNGEAWLIGTNITPLATASTHYVTEPIRSRKLLLNRRELDKLEAGVNYDRAVIVHHVDSAMACNQQERQKKPGHWQRQSRF